MRRIVAGVAVAALAVGIGLLVYDLTRSQSHPQARVYTSPAAPQVVQPAGRHFQGRNSKNLGTIVVHKRSVLHWASDSVVFQLWDAGQRIKVHTQEHAGKLVVKPGTYKKVSVIAFGNWLITISPG
ncbi:MAG: hypothetical protein ABSB24_19640 [Gaiellaceae bacterium]|jgi:hypothetical protein